MEENIVEIKNCKHCNISFNITDLDLEFYKKVSPKFNEIIYDIPAPKLCPDCRQQRRLSVRNESNLYKRKCDATGKEIISIFKPDNSYTVYDNDYWWSDKWNALDYGREFDFDRSFFDQFNELLLNVPRINLYNQKSENSPYSNFESDEKNCYLTIGGHWNEDCMYGHYYIESKDSVDNYWLFNSDNCYECFNCYNLHKCFYLQYSTDCSECFLGYDLKNCSNCFGCAGLRNKKYYIFNKSYTQEEYNKKLESLDYNNSNNFNDINKIYKEVYLSIPHKNLNISGSENCIGDDIFNSKNLTNCFSAEDIENAKYSHIIGMGKDCMDISSVGMMELFYEFSSGGMNGYKNVFSQFCYGCNNVYYSDNCHYSSNIFGCTGLRNKEFCIFNKQYTKEDYELLLPKIIEHMSKTGEWGEFFPSSISAFGYNETVANEYYPLNKEKALNLDFKWSDYEAPFSKVEKIIPASKLPGNIKDIPDDILNWAIECEITKKPFRIIKQELEFYRKHNLPIPKKHPKERHNSRIKLGNKKKICERKCDKCGIEIKTTYPPHRKEIVYCENCYNKEIY